MCGYELPITGKNLAPQGLDIFGATFWLSCWLLFEVRAKKSSPLTQEGVSLYIVLSQNKQIHFSMCTTQVYEKIVFKVLGFRFLNFHIFSENSKLKFFFNKVSLTKPAILSCFALLRSPVSLSFSLESV